MRHIPTLRGYAPGSVQGQALAQLRRFNSPHLVVLTRAEKPPIPGLASDEGDEKTPADPDRSNGGQKRALRGMSAKSSLNLARLLSTLDWNKNGCCIHVSCTYHEIFPTTKKELACEKSRLCVYLARFGFCGIWRLEFQERGAPHFHCLLWCQSSREVELVPKLVRWWCRFSKNFSEFACKVTSGDQVRGRWYLAMHAAKREQAPSFEVGRWWGYINREKVLEACDIHETGSVEERERVWWARLYRRATGCKVRQSQGLSWFLPLREQWRVHSWILQQMCSERKPRNPF